MIVGITLKAPLKTQKTPLVVIIVCFVAAVGTVVRLSVGLLIAFTTSQTLGSTTSVFGLFLSRLKKK
jgi:hypothetical protein